MKKANSPPERDINNNLHDKLTYCRLIEFVDDIADIHKDKKQENKTWLSLG